MSDITIKVEITLDRFPELKKAAAGQIDKICRSAAFDGLGYVIDNFSAGVSAPGKPPGVDTGTLKGSMHVKTLGKSLYAIRAATHYAILLEYGTTKMAARPFMTPMAKWLNDNFANYIDAEGLF